MQKAIGPLTQAVETLTQESRETRSKLSETSQKIYAAEVTIKVVGGILTLIGAWILILLWKIWAVIAPLIELKFHH
jgi:hypothetical protein